MIGRPRQSHCKRRHEFTAENTIVTGKNSKYPRRACRVCFNMMMRENYTHNPVYRARKKAQNAARIQRFYAKNGFWPSALYG